MRGMCFFVVCMLFFLSNAPHAAYGESLLDEAVRDYQFQDFIQAEDKFSKLLISEPDNMTAHYYIGIIYQQQGKYALAIRHLTIVAHSSTQAQGIDKALANAYLSGGQAEKAFPYFHQQYLKNPESEQAVFDYANVLEAMENTDQAAKIYRRIIAENGQFANAAAYQLGQMLSAMGAYVSALKLMQSIEPDSPYGDAAKQGQKALEAATRPVNLYVSSEYFFDDNPSISTSRRIPSIAQAPPKKRGSQGITLIAALNTRQFEATDHARIKLAYLYYATFYQQAFAKENDFIEHLINPSLVYQFNSKIDMELKGDVQLFYFNHQKLNANYGSTWITTYHIDEINSFNVHLAYLHRKYTGDFKSQGVSTSLAYLDANAWSIGTGGTFTSDVWGSSLSVDYTLNHEQTTHGNDSDIILARRANDSRFREHLVRINTMLPILKNDARIAILGNINYAYKDYLNPQSGALYPDITGRQRIQSILLTLGTQVQVHLWKKYNLDFGLGYERNHSHSHAASLTYQTNRYFGQLSGRY